ncbi:LysR family transcriptional regulator [Corynebacterium aquatimens]|uniref:hydrogen peroxide-inducible genes activator n=1 Tax=Corynebacterium TaxID=1716 RepID=UPI001F1B4E9B|nr:MULTISPECIES: hydrogen peroxide-inducible genes activator [Corynebacterium]QYH19625.1 LysR family transcriptional regulator [Corynebacterium aquatimens]UIZ91387.1 LysR family transcriptional regulator [Corynebacterium sp. CNCTC7651]
MSNKAYKPTLAQLRSFVTVAEHKHFGIAASKLGISQPSLSQGLVALESGLGIQLIERSTRKVIVTPHGEALLPYAKAALDAVDAFVVRSRGTEGTLAGTLTIGIIPTIAPYLLPHLLGELARAFPDCAPRVVEEKTDNLVEQLRDGQLDVAVLALPVDAPGLETVELYREPFIAVTPAGQVGAPERVLELTDLRELELLLLDDGHCLRDQIVDLCKLADATSSVTSQSVTRAASLTTIVQLVVAGLGSTLVPLSAVETECGRPGLDLHSFADGTSAEREVGLAYRASSSRVEDFSALAALVTEAYGRATAPAEAALRR